LKYLVNFFEKVYVVNVFEKYIRRNRAGSSDYRAMIAAAACYSIVSFCVISTRRTLGRRCSSSSMSRKYCISIQDVKEAMNRIRAHVHRTPVLTCSELNEEAGGVELFFKCELFQKTGSFKIRGATNACLSLSDDDAKRGLITHSSGNHAQAVALAAR